MAAAAPVPQSLPAVTATLGSGGGIGQDCPCVHFPHIPYLSRVDLPSVLYCVGLIGEAISEARYATTSGKTIPPPHLTCDVLLLNRL